MKELKILVLDDEQRVRDEIEEFLLGNHYTVYKAASPSEAFNLLRNVKIDIGIIDIKLPEMDGISVMKKIKEQDSSVEIIMISGHGDMNSVIDAMRLGATDYFPKPFRLLEINNAIERTKRFLDLNRKLKEVEDSNALLSSELHHNIGQRLLGNSLAMKTVVELMTRVAKTDATSVLITGESGTGKELVARGIHYLSERSKKSFHSVNCSAIPESLFESEFFGHKKGAFTGATEDKDGWFEIANNGTLFLDEIIDMPLNQQAKLLRVLEDKKVSKVGSRQEKAVDVRVIAASNRNLEEKSEKHKFRIDLYHRLSSFVIHIPPLRERKDDIPQLINYFIAEYAHKMAKTIQSIDPEIFDQLSNYSFPGNVRELKNMVERAIIMCDSSHLGVSHFALSSLKNNEIQEISSDNLDLELTERKMILQALKQAENNKSKAAELLNISWQSLDRRLKKYKIKI